MSLSSPIKASQSGEASLPAVLLLLLVLAVSWVLWSGLYKPLLLGLGVFSCLLSAYLAHRMGFFRHKALMALLPGLPGYWLWLLREIAISSFDVARIILKPTMPISPVVVEMETNSDNEVNQVILGNSITLSPGTVTLDVYKGKLLVHCLTKQGAEALRSGELVERASRLERG